MIRRVIQLFVAFIPLLLFAIVLRGLTWAGWIQTQWGWVATLFVGMVLFTTVEVLIFKLWLLPSWAQAISEQIYAGNYIPEDDPLVALSFKIMEEHRSELIPELEKLVKSDAQRTRGWLELAGVCLTEQQDTLKAAEYLLLGAKTVRNKEDAAMLMWRAYTLLSKDDGKKQRAADICRHLIETYPGTTYSRFAVNKLRELS